MTNHMEFFSKSKFGLFVHLVAKHHPFSDGRLASTVDETGEPDSASVSWGELFVRPAIVDRPWLDGRGVSQIELGRKEPWNEEKDTFVACRGFDIGDGADVCVL